MDLIMHRVTEESWLTKSADGSIARRTRNRSARARGGRHVGLDRMCLLMEVRSQKAEKASGHTSEVPPVALALELVVILVVRRRPGNGSPISSQHVTAARRVTRIEHHPLQAHLIFLEVREIELTSRQRDAISYMTVRISKMWVLLKDLGHKTPGHEGSLSLVLEAHLERQKPGEGRRSRWSLPPFLLKVRSQPPPTTELLKRSKVCYSP